MTTAPIRLLIADDHPVVLGGLVALLSVHRDIAVVAQASTGREAVALYEQHRPDVAALDLRMPDLSGLDALVQIRALDPGARVLILTTFDGDEDVYRSLQSGARGYMLKHATPGEIVAAIQSVSVGQRYIPQAISLKYLELLEQSALTPREVDVLALAAVGEKNRQIANRLGLTVGSVKSYINSILTKLGARDRTEAVTIGFRRGIIRIDGISRPDGDRRRSL